MIFAWPSTCRTKTTGPSIARISVTKALLWDNFPDSALRCVVDQKAAELRLWGIDEDGTIFFETGSALPVAYPVCLVSADLYALGYVKGCLSLGPTNIIGVRLGRQESRRYARFPDHVTARLTFFGGSRALGLDVRVCDVSRFGFLLVSHTGVDIGSTVELSLDYGLVMARVRDCMNILDNGYQIDVEILTTIFRRECAAAVLRC